MVGPESRDIQDSHCGGVQCVFTVSALKSGLTEAENLRNSLTTLVRFSRVLMTIKAIAERRASIEGTLEASPLIILRTFKADIN